MKKKLLFGGSFILVLYFVLFMGGSFKSKEQNPKDQQVIASKDFLSLGEESVINEDINAEVLTESKIDQKDLVADVVADVVEENNNEDMTLENEAVAQNLTDVELPLEENKVE
jgi:hypothetical protein